MARILIAEPDEGLATVWRAALERDGHQVVHKTSGLDALGSAQREPPEVAIVELMLSGCGGLALVGRIKLGTPETKVIVITGHPTVLASRVNGLALARRAGANLTLEKPVPLEVLIDCVRHLLDQSA